MRASEFDENIVDPVNSIIRNGWANLFPPTNNCLDNKSRRD